MKIRCGDEQTAQILFDQLKHGVGRVLKRTLINDTIVELDFVWPEEIEVKA